MGVAGRTARQKPVILARAMTAVEKRMQPARYGRASAGHFDTRFLHPVSGEFRTFLRRSLEEDPNRGSLTPAGLGSGPDPESPHP